MVVLLGALYLGVGGVASAAQRPAASDLQLEPGVGSLTSSWGATSTAGLKGFRVRWRPLGTPGGAWGKSVDVPAKTRSYAIAGLQPAAYEVLVRSIVGTTHRAASGHKKTSLVLGGFTTGAATALAIGAELPGELPVPPKELPKETEPPAEKGKEQPKEAPKEQPKEEPKEQPKEAPKEQPKEEPKEQPKEEHPKNSPKKNPKNSPKKNPKKNSPKKNCRKKKNTTKKKNSRTKNRR